MAKKTLTLKYCKTKLNTGDIIQHKKLRNADNTFQRFKITSIKTWKTRPDKILIGLKRGLYEYYKINETDLSWFFIEG